MSAALHRADRAGRRRQFRDFPLFWRLLVPFMSLILVMGFLGTFVIVRNLSQRARAAVDLDLSRRSVDVRTHMHDRELYLLESVNFASNIEGIARAIKERDAGAVERLLRSVLALKKDVDRLVVTDATGRALVEFVRPSSSEDLRTRPGSDWSGDALFAAALRGPAGARSAGFARRDGVVEMLVAGPVCSGTPGCVAIGAAAAAMRLDRVVDEALALAGPTRSSLSIFAADGGLLQKSGTAIPPPGNRVDPRGERATAQVHGADVAILYAPFRVGTRTGGTIAVGLPTAPAFQSVRGAGVRLALIVFAGMLAVVVIGVIQSKRILRQVNPLVNASRELGKGNLAARAAVMGDDELGELARRINMMAEQLQASHETMESRVTQRTDEIERLLRERSDFFAAMSHEFRTPIAVILGQAEMLQDAQEDGDAAPPGAAPTIRRSGEQLLGLVNEILDLAESDVGGMEVDIDDVTVKEVLDELRPTIEGLAAASDLKVRYDIPRTLPAVRGDRGRVKQIMLNLVDNAAKYTPDKGKIAISAEARDGHVAICVEDTGIGIPPGTGNLIFEPFYRVKGNRPRSDRASSGLGLALAKRFALAQNGSLEYVSKPGQGTTFTLLLPASDRSTK